MTTAAILARALTITAAVAIGGCQDPYRAAQQPAAATPAPSGRATDIQRPGPQARPLAPGERQRATTARRAARAFALGWVNWDWRSAADRQRALARLATGNLALRLEANAASARIDASLARDRPGSRGDVAAINLRASDDRASGIVVTREQTTTTGRADLGGRRYRVYLVRLERDRHGWGVSAWQPQP